MGGAFMSQVLELATFCPGATKGCFLLHWDVGCGMNILALGPEMAISSKPVVFPADLCTLGNMGLWRGRLCAFGLSQFQQTSVSVVVQRVAGPAPSFLTSGLTHETLGI